MAYLKPSAFERNVFNKLAMRFGITGAHRLTVAGRETGQPRAVPVIPVEVGGERYVVSTRGEAAWVRNARAAGAVELEGKQLRGRFRAVELPEPEREPVIAAYRPKAGKTVDRYWKELPDAADHPVFRLDPA
jgi:deazaflavin-dependent oxidoreductase (nitroreductase family)